MHPEESGLRRALAQRTFRPPEEIWPAVRRELTDRKPRGQAAAWWAGAAVLIVVLAVFRGRTEPIARPLPPEGFGVTNVRSLGRPATSIVLRPDPKTVIVVVD
jgi:hypothetical protein